MHAFVVCVCECVYMCIIQERAIRFVISFLQHALFEQFSNTTKAEDSKILRDRQILRPSTNRLGLEEITYLTPQMETAVRFREKRRNVLIKAIEMMNESLRKSLTKK